MALNLLQIINQVQGELGLPMSASIVGNPDPTTVQMYSLAQRCLDEMRVMNPTGWSVLQNEFEIFVNPPLITTGTITNLSQVISGIPSTAGLVADYWAISANSIPQAARIISVDSSTQVTMSQEATGTVVNSSIVFAKDTYPFPGDYDWTQNRTHWDRTNRWELLGPDSPQMDQWHRSGIVATGPRRHFRRLGQFPNKFRIWPPPAEIVNPLQLVFEYMSVNAVQTAVNSTASFTGSISGNILTVSNVIAGNIGLYQVISGAGVTAGTQINTLISGSGGVGTYQLNNSMTVGSSTITSSGQSFSQYFNNDTDVPLLNDQAVATGIKWMFWEIKGFNVESLQSRWVDYVERLIARDESAPTLNLVQRTNPMFISPANVQDGFFPGPVGPNMG